MEQHVSTHRNGRYSIAFKAAQLFIREKQLT